LAERVRVGRVGRPHGLDGSFVVEEASEAPGRFEEGASLLVGEEPIRIESSKRAGGRPVIRVDRPVARGDALEVFVRDLPPADEDAYYVFQLVGLDVMEEDGRPLGKVLDVVPGVANDVLQVEGGLLLPLAETCVREIDLDAGTILVSPGFADPD
jgi:16S rRNA processing protein RimM